MPTDSPVSVTTCPACDAEVIHGSNFCGVCGSDLTPIWKAMEDAYVDTIVAGRYRVRHKIGSGGMGEVYLAEHERLGQKVAIKFLSQRLIRDEKVVRRFFNEARSTCRVAHHGAVSLNDFGQTDEGVLYIIMEYIDGTPLNKVVEQRGRLDMPTALHIALQLCDTLHSAHEQGVIHRDLKPDNIMLVEGRGGRFSTKILDFGIAKLIDDGETSRLTEAGMVFGTPEFMSPEQCLGREVDGRSDQYAVAIVLYYMLSGGYLPIQGGNRMELLNRQVSEPAVRLSVRAPEARVPDALERVILKALEKRPDARYPSVHHFAEALEHVTLEMNNSGLISGAQAPLMAMMHQSDGQSRANTPDRPSQASNLGMADTVPASMPLASSGPYAMGSEPRRAIDPSWAPGGGLGTFDASQGPSPAAGPEAENVRTSGGFDIDLSTESREVYIHRRSAGPPWIWIGVALVVLAAAGVGVWFTVFADKANPQPGPSELTTDAGADTTTDDAAAATTDDAQPAQAEDAQAADVEDNDKKTPPSRPTRTRRGGAHGDGVKKADPPKKVDPPKVDPPKKVDEPKKPDNGGVLPPKQID